jgi:hypothetical protein
LQKPIEGSIRLLAYLKGRGVYTRHSNKPQKTKQPKTTKTHQRRKKTGNTGCWVVGLGDNLRGRRESVLKSVFSKPFHPTRFSVFDRSPPYVTRL